MTIRVLGKNGFFDLHEAQADRVELKNPWVSFFSKAALRRGLPTAGLYGPRNEVIGMLQLVLKDLIVGEGDYWASDPEFPVEDWQTEVDNGDTRQGYHDWLLVKRQWAEEDKEADAFMAAEIAGTEVQP